MHTLCFVLKNVQNFVDLDACKQLFVLDSYKSATKKPEVKKNHKSNDLNQTTLAVISGYLHIWSELSLVYQFSSVIFCL